MPPPVFRFAPSPNGHLHLGHAYSALLNFDLACRTGGRFLLRIEDIDATRCKPEFETAIYEDLGWLGIGWEQPVRRQSEHLSEYRDAVDKLIAQGLVYPSFESRAEIARLVALQEAKAPWPRDPDGAPLYPGTAKSLPADERARLLESGAPYALRLDMAAASERAGDFGWIERGASPDGETGTVAAPGRRPGATSSSRAGRRRPVITSRWWSTMRCRASQKRCGGRTCSGRPASIGCCNNCSVWRHRPIGTTASSSMMRGENSRSRPWPRACANCAPRARRRPTSGASWVCLNCGRTIPSRKS